MEDCIFCKISKGEIPCHKIYENGEVMAFLDINPVNPGHTLVIPKSHYKDILETPPDVLCRMATIVQEIAPAILEGIGALAFNLNLNNGKEAGQIIFHAHFHIVPRFTGDGHALWKGNKPDENYLKEIAEKIRENIAI
jgi:histidine triad (HIT) family protein